MRLHWERFDRHRDLTWLAVGGLAVGVLLAVFGLPPLELHGPQHRLGIMMPTCGGTRALRFTLLGDLAQAWRYNPLSVFLAAGAALALLRTLIGAACGRWMNVTLHRGRIAWALLLVVLAVLWIRQQLHAELLMGP